MVKIDEDNIVIAMADGSEIAIKSSIKPSVIRFKLWIPILYLWHITGNTLSIRLLNTIYTGTIKLATALNNPTSVSVANLDNNSTPAFVLIALMVWIPKNGSVARNKLIENLISIFNVGLIMYLYSSPH